MEGLSLTRKKLMITHLIVLSNFETLSVVPFLAFTNLSVAGKLIAEEKTGNKKMGSVLGGAMKETMDDNMKKSQEFMLQTQKIQVRQC